jgi:hypothetical protein
MDSFENCRLLWQEASTQVKVIHGSMMTRKYTSKPYIFAPCPYLANPGSLAIENTLETTSIGDVPLDIQKYEIPTNANPYVLPWIMRGLLEEDFVKTELDAEVTDLLKQFDDWKPSTKVLKDVKYRLEAVRSKL